jgi:hypothetical protein
MTNTLRTHCRFGCTNVVLPGETLCPFHLVGPSGPASPSAPKTPNTNVGSAELTERIAARRARRAEGLQAAEAEAEARANLKRAGNRFGDDSVQAAYLLGLERAEADVTTYAFKWARRENYREARAAVARRRREGEMKYADAWTPSDPTGEAAVSTGTARALLQADTFAHDCVGKRGARVDWAGLAAATGTTEAEARVKAAGALHAARNDGPILKRARAAGISATALAAAAAEAEASPDKVTPRGGSVLVAELKPARRFGPAVLPIR